MSKEAKQFYIISHKQIWGDDAVWWRPNRQGYTSRLDEAGKYSEEDAAGIKLQDDVPLPCAKVDAAAHRSVDIATARKIERDQA